MQQVTDSKIDYIKNSLALNFTQTQIAKGLGISESAVSQLISTYNIEVKGSSSKVAAQLDNLFDEIELNAAQKLQKALAVCDLDPVRLAAVLSRVNGLKRRSHGEGQGVLSKTAELVQLELPQHLTSHVNVVRSPQNEIIEIEGRAVTTIDRSKLNTLGKDIDNLFAPPSTTGTQPDPSVPVGMPSNVLLETSALQQHEDLENGNQSIAKAL